MTSIKRQGFLQCFLGLLACLFAMAGCARINPPAVFKKTQQVVESRTGLGIEWQLQAVETPELQRATTDLLAQPLSLDSAVRLALMSNHALQAQLSELGIAQSELLQSSLPKNPEISLSHRYLHGAENGHDTNTEAGISQEVMSLALLPWARSIAKGNLERAHLAAADAVLELVRQVQDAYFTARGRQAALVMERQAFKATEAAIELAKAQHEVGNMSDLDLSRQLAEYQHQRLEIAGQETRLLADRERLNRLMSLWGKPALQWTLPDGLPDPPKEDPSVESLENRAIRERLDLATLRVEVQALGKGIRLTRWSRWLPGLKVGVDTERDVDGSRVTGPTLNAEIPILDWGQARLGKSEAQFRQSRQRMAALAVDIRSKVRETALNLQAARQTALFYRDILLPERQRSLKLAMLHYQGMFLGTDELLRIKREELETHRAYLESVQNYWIARAALERELGGALRSQDVPDAHAPTLASPLTGEGDRKAKPPHEPQKTSSAADSQHPH